MLRIRSFTISMSVICILTTSLCAQGVQPEVGNPATKLDSSSLEYQLERSSIRNALSLTREQSKKIDQILSDMNVTDKNTIQEDKDSYLSGLLGEKQIQTIGFLRTSLEFAEMGLGLPNRLFGEEYANELSLTEEQIQKRLKLCDEWIDFTLKEVIHESKSRKGPKYWVGPFLLKKSKVFDAMALEVYIKDILTPKQSQRLRELELRRSLFLEGISAINVESIREELQLSSSQEEMLETLAKEPFLSPYESKNHFDDFKKTFSDSQNAVWSRLIGSEPKPRIAPEPRTAED